MTAKLLKIFSSRPRGAWMMAPNAIRPRTHKPPSKIRAGDQRWAGRGGESQLLDRLGSEICQHHLAFPSAQPSIVLDAARAASVYSLPLAWRNGQRGNFCESQESS